MPNPGSVDNKTFSKALSLPGLATIDSLTISNGMRGNVPVFTVPEPTIFRVLESCTRLVGLELNFVPYHLPVTLQMGDGSIWREGNLSILPHTRYNAD
jgi:hypothetical protein